MEAFLQEYTMLQQLLKEQALPQALLFCAPSYVPLQSFASKLATTLLCKEQSEPCGVCKSCHLMAAGTHPDYSLITPEAVGGVIKIEQIRALKDVAFETPQQGGVRVVLLSPADAMNLASSNALLKLLEEPPEFLYFILMAEQLSYLPATIVSRCQKWFFDSSHEVDYLELGQYYSDESSRAKLYTERGQLLTQCCEVIEGKRLPSDVASRWRTYSLEDILWYFYLLAAQAIRLQLDKTATAGYLERFVTLTNPVTLFRLLAKINEIRQMVVRRITLNQPLAIEALFLCMQGHHD